MKRWILITILGGLLALFSVRAVAVSFSEIRLETRFLTDKMAYELGLDSRQYEDVYEINFDFIYNVSRFIDRAVMGYSWAIDDYYMHLDIRNDDLRWVLTERQFRRFMRRDYFCRPIYMEGPSWHFRIYIVYHNHHHFYYPEPRVYYSYRGGHCRRSWNSPSHYSGRYHHNHYRKSYRLREGRARRESFKSDFGSVRVRPNTSMRPRNYEPTLRDGRDTQGISGRVNTRDTRQGSFHIDNGSIRSSEIKVHDGKNTQGTSGRVNTRDTHQGSFHIDNGSIRASEIKVHDSKNRPASTDRVSTRENKRGNSTTGRVSTHETKRGNSTTGRVSTRENKRSNSSTGRVSTRENRRSNSTTGRVSTRENRRSNSTTSRVSTRENKRSQNSVRRATTRENKNSQGAGRRVHTRERN